VVVISCGRQCNKDATAKHHGQMGVFIDCRIQEERL
jgi:hypothetical protein